MRDLTRVRLGPLTLHGLEPGDSRPLTAREVKELKSLSRKQEARRRDDETTGE